MSRNLAGGGGTRAEGGGAGNRHRQRTCVALTVPKSSRRMAGGQGASPRETPLRLSGIRAEREMVCGACKRCTSVGLNSLRGEV